jgi:hypothetical protein
VLAPEEAIVEGSDPPDRLATAADHEAPAVRVSVVGVPGIEQRPRPGGLGLGLVVGQALDALGQREEVRDRRLARGERSTRYSAITPPVSCEPALGEGESL